MFEKLDGFFPLPSPPRPKQAAALDFIWRMLEAGYRDIVVAAPTGIGKTGIGMAACLWGARPSTATELKQKPGGYYLVTQKLLQDQITDDFTRFPPQFKDTGITLKSASEYVCESHNDCGSGHAATTAWLTQCKGSDAPPPMPGPEEDVLRPCSSLAHVDGAENRWVRRPDKHLCPYEFNKREFTRRQIGVTNYAYWLSERSYVGAFPIKNVLVLDECHSIERSLLGFVELGITPRQVQEYSKDVENKVLESVDEFIEWMDEDYGPSVQLQYEYFRQRAIERPKDKTLNRKFKAVENHYRRVAAAVDGLKREPGNWVYWCEEKEDGFHYVLKPLNAAPYFKKLIVDSSAVRIYMSAYPGPKALFCATLGLDPNKVAWKNLASTFPIQHRPIHMIMVGSMGRNAIQDTMPNLLSTTTKILDKHAKQKGLIHCHSYHIGKAIYSHLQNTEHGARILFPAAAGNRADLFYRHRATDEPTVLLSPSMTEGFSLDDDLARFQIIAKTPFPYLGDCQIRVKMERNRDWYTLQTVMTIIQACGRIVRSDTDYGDTYILDKDFYRVYNEENIQFFPKWFTDAFVWHKK